MNALPVALARWVLILAVVSTAARAAYLESDAPPGTVERRPPPDIERPAPPPPFPPRLDPVADLLRRLDPGAPFHYGGLTVVPLSAGGTRAGSDLWTLDEAVSRGWLVLRELDESRVAFVQASNTSRHPVFLMAGEILLGGRQNRIVRDDVLLPPLSGFLDIAVYCGEKERWTDAGRPLSGGGTVVHPALRKSAAAGASQEAVWAEIDAQSARSNVRSPTRDYQRIYEDGAVRRELDAYVERFRDRRPPATVGMVALVHGTIVGADVFSSPDLCARQWDKLLRAYAVDATGRGDRSSAYDPAVRDVRWFLQQAAAARVVERPTPGEGRRVELYGSVEGGGLVWNGQVVHLALFGGGRPVPVDPPHPPIRPLPRWE